MNTFELNGLTVIRAHVSPPRIGMRSGQGDALDAACDFAVGRSGRAWLWRPMNASFIYCTDRDDWAHTGRGFSGAHLPIKLTPKGSAAYREQCQGRNHEPCKGELGHESFVLRGGWHSNDDALLNETGIDLTETHVTYGIVALANHYHTNVSAWQPADLCGIFYNDPAEGRAGTYSRIAQIAERFATELSRPVFYYSHSAGGSTQSHALPSGWRAVDQPTIDWFRGHKNDCTVTG